MEVIDNLKIQNIGRPPYWPESCEMEYWQQQNNFGYSSCIRMEVIVDLKNQWKGGARGEGRGVVEEDVEELGKGGGGKG